jgi:O-acetyl-ADP-ribose deacetylase (regulator of RNase III)
LPAGWVIHTVGPVWRGGREGEDEVLASCYRTALALAAERRFAHVAFPAISCGIYGFPVPRACRIAVTEIRVHLATAVSPARVSLIAFDAEVAAEYQAILGAV